MPEPHRVGHDTDAYCTKCKMDLGAVVIAIVDGVAVKVECLTCHTVRKYRPPKSAPRPKKTSSRKKAASKKKSSSRSSRAKVSVTTEHQLWMEKLAGRSAEDAVRYDIRKDYAADVVLSHSKFGLGVVTGQVSSERIKVQFQDAERTLIVNYAR